MEGKWRPLQGVRRGGRLPHLCGHQGRGQAGGDHRLISKSFGGINLEDIAAPRCFEVERRLKEVCDIPVFHDDQHGTAIVVAAALLNAMRVTGKQMGR